MDFSVNGIISLVEMFDPNAKPLLEKLRTALPYLPKASAVVFAAVREGGAAYTAATAAAPELTKAIKDLAGMLPHKPVEMDSGLHQENVTRVLFGLGRMTSEQEKRWMDLATPGNNPADENSKFPIG